MLESIDDCGKAFAETFGHRRQVLVGIAINHVPSPDIRNKRPTTRPVTSLKTVSSNASLVC